MSSRNVAIVEPHPSISNKTGGTYIHSGRGGAGNYKRYKSEELTSGPTANGPASRISLSKSLKRPSFLPAGRGGSGNMYKSSTTETEERMFQFDEEMSRRSDAQAPVYHIGRGGAANWVDERAELSSRGRQDSASSTNSATSESSHVRGALNKLTRRFS